MLLVQQVGSGAPLVALLTQLPPSSSRHSSSRHASSWSCITVHQPVQTRSQPQLSLSPVITACGGHASRCLPSRTPFYPSSMALSSATSSSSPEPMSAAATNASPSSLSVILLLIVLSSSGSSNDSGLSELLLLLYPSLLSSEALSADAVHVARLFLQEVRVLLVLWLLLLLLLQTLAHWHPE